MTAYRAGDVAPIIRTLAGVSLVAVVNGRHVASAEPGIRARNAQGGIDRIVEDGILHKIRSADRNRACEAQEVLPALDDFAARAKRVFPGLSISQRHGRRRYPNVGESAPFGDERRTMASRR